MNNEKACVLAQTYATPLYVYDLDVVRQRAQALQQAITWPHTQLLYAIKANPCPGIAKTLLPRALVVTVLLLARSPSLKPAASVPIKCSIPKII